VKEKEVKATEEKPKEVETPEAKEIVTPSAPSKTPVKEEVEMPVPE
jgi:hypothetical protein